jgi:hypothetical protein
MITTILTMLGFILIAVGCFLSAALVVVLWEAK